MSSWFDILILVILIGMNGAFALSEVALITSRRARLQHMDEESVPGARRAMDMNADPNRALSTIQVGITSIGLLSGIFGESALAKPVPNGSSRSAWARRQPRPSASRSSWCCSRTSRS